MILKLTSPPGVEPVTLPEAKQHLRADGDDDNGLISSLITAARVYCENVQGRAFITQTWRLTLDRFPCAGEVVRDGEYLRPRSCQERAARGVILLPRAPAIAVSSVQYIDRNGTTQTLSSSGYTLDSDSEPARLFPSYGNDWPSTRDDLKAAIITYTAGYGATAANTPETVKQAIKLLVGSWYENREGVLTGTISKEIEFAIEALLSQDRVH
jgi:hypothetical protein